MFTLILPEGEVQTREGQNHESLIVSNRDKYSLQLTPKVKGNWERRSRGKNRSQRENERKRNKSGCEEKEDNKKKWMERPRGSGKMKLYYNRTWNMERVRENQDIDSAVLRKHVLKIVKHQTWLIFKFASSRDYCSLWDPSSTFQWFIISLKNHYRSLAWKNSGMNREPSLYFVKIIPLESQQCVTLQDSELE